MALDSESHVSSMGIRLLSTMLLFGMVAFHEDAFAQRGAQFDRNDEGPELGTWGFPGFLDTEQVPRGSLVADFPALSLDYGVHERLSLGTNIFLTAPLAFGVPSGFVKSRYRLFSNAKVVSSLSGYFGGLIASPTRFYFGAFTSNTAVAIGSDQTIGISLLAGRTGYQNGSVGEVDFASLSGTFTFAFIQYRWGFSELSVLNVALGAPVIVSFDVDSTSAAGSLDFGTAALASDVLFSQISMDWLVSDEFLLTGGLFAVSSINNLDSGLGLYPLIGGMYRFD